jgi:hypothetical protein
MRKQKPTRQDLANEFGVTPARISQIAKEMGIWPVYELGMMRYYPKDARKMRERDTKSGPKPRRNGAKK